MNNLLSSRFMSCLLAVAAVLLPSLPVQAHHSFASEFDINQPIELVGKVNRMQWSNPHAWIHIDVTTASGEVQTWMVEGGAPNALFRRGWNRDSLPPGTEVRVKGYRARDMAFRANGTEVILADGSRLFVGSSAPDAR